MGKASIKKGYEKRRPRRMSDGATQRAWQAENTAHFGFRLQNSTDADIIEYLAKAKADGRSVQGEIKKALRMLIASTQTESTE